VIYDTGIEKRGLTVLLGKGARAYEIAENGDFCLRGKKNPVYLRDKISIFNDYYHCIAKVFFEEMTRVSERK
jgi:hypothetical protein